MVRFESQVTLHHEMRGRNGGWVKIACRHGRRIRINLFTMMERVFPFRKTLGWVFVFSSVLIGALAGEWTGSSAFAQSAPNQNQSAPLLIPHVRVAPTANGRGGLRAVTRPTIMNPTGGRLFGAAAGWNPPVGGIAPNRFLVRGTGASSPPKNPDFKVLLASANRGNAAAEFAVGLRYLYGVDVAKDIARARQWLTRAASRGFPNAAAILKALPD